MKLFHKRMLILFSVGLNIGFIIAAIIWSAQHPPDAHGGFRNDMADLVKQIQLEPEREAAVLDTIFQYRDMMMQFDQDMHQAREAVIVYLARSGPVDRAQLHQLFETIDAQEEHRSVTFEAHVLDLRNQMGDEKGALFFSLLLKQIQTRDRAEHR